MWIMTPVGFVSIVKVEQGHAFAGCYAIRSRSGKQLQDFVNRYLTPTVEKSATYLAVITKTPSNDYAYRIYVSEKKLQEVFVQLSKSIDYPNFKNACMGTTGYKKFLSEVWNVGANFFGSYGQKGKYTE